MSGIGFARLVAHRRALALSNTIVACPEAVSDLQKFALETMRIAPFSIRLGFLRIIEGFAEFGATQVV